MKKAEVNIFDEAEIKKANAESLRRERKGSKKIHSEDYSFEREKEKQENIHQIQKRQNRKKGAK